MSLHPSSATSPTYQIQTLGRVSEASERSKEPLDSYFREFQPTGGDDHDLPPLDVAEPRRWTVTTSERDPSIRAPSKKNAFGNAYWGISGILGFRERYSLFLGFVFGGALFGFCLARTTMFNPATVRDHTMAGEWFWYRQSVFKPSIFLHIYASIFAGLGAVFQFIPAIRRRWMLFHRINGYMTLFMLVPGTVAGAIVGRRAFGNSPEMQAAYYVCALLIVGAATMGIATVKETRKHRKWMLRSVAYLGSVITARFVSLSARAIISYSGKYFSVWSCAELLFVQQSGRGDPNFSKNYPTCMSTNDPNNTFVLVHASDKELPINEASGVRITFGMGIWIGMIIHILAVEFYLQASESSNQQRRGYVLEPKPAEDLIMEGKVMNIGR